MRCSPQAAVVHKQQWGRPHIQVQKRLTGHLIIGWCQGEMLPYGMNVTQAAFQTADLVGGSRASRTEHQFSRLLG